MYNFKYVYIYIVSIDVQNIRTNTYSTQFSAVSERVYSFVYKYERIVNGTHRIERLTFAVFYKIICLTFKSNMYINMYVSMHADEKRNNLHLHHNELNICIMSNTHAFIIVFIYYVHTYSHITIRIYIYRNLCCGYIHIRISKENTNNKEASILFLKFKDARISGTFRCFC